MRMKTNLLFSTALACTLLLKALPIPEPCAWLAVLSVASAAIFTHLMPAPSRSVGLAGLGGLVLAYHRLPAHSFSATGLLVIVAGLVLAAVISTIFADSFTHSKGDHILHETKSIP